MIVEIAAEESIAPKRSVFLLYQIAKRYAWDGLKRVGFIHWAFFVQGGYVLHDDHDSLLCIMLSATNGREAASARWVCVLGARYLMKIATVDYRCLRS